jgi:hypothetical protein
MNSFLKFVVSQVSKSRPGAPGNLGNPFLVTDLDVGNPPGIRYLSLDRSLNNGYIGA